MPVPSLTAVLRYAVHYLTIQVAVMLTTCALDLSAKGKQKKKLYVGDMELFLTNHVLLLEDDDVFILKETF